jgi:dephospho-CoA kinase
MIIGLTGGIATGKSTAAKYLEQKGAEIIDADKIAHQVSRKGEKGWQKVVSEFGEEILKEDNEFDRAKLAKIVFSNSVKRKKLESLLHPIIIKKMKEKANKYLNQNKTVVLMAPLLFEAGIDKFCDQVWLIAASQEEQIKRIIKRDGITKEEAIKRIESQMSQAEKKEKSDIVITNNDSKEKLKKKIDYYWDKTIRET